MAKSICTTDVCQQLIKHNWCTYNREKKQGKKRKKMENDAEKTLEDEEEMRRVRNVKGKREIERK